MPGRPSLRWNTGSGLARLAVGSAGYPDASNTGVPVGTSLTDQSGVVSTSSNGQIIQDLHLTSTDGALLVNHNNVTVRRCRIESVIVMDSATSGTLIEDCHIHGNYVNGNTIIAVSNNAGAPAVINRCRIQGGENGISFDSNCTLTNSFIHDLWNDTVGGAHADGAQFGSAMTNFTARHNTVIATGAPSSGAPNEVTTSCFIMDNANQSNFLVEDNVFSGANQTLYGTGTGSTNTICQNNKFWTLLYGPSNSGFSGTIVPNTMTYSGNELGHFVSYDDTNKLIVGSWTATGTVP